MAIKEGLPPKFGYGIRRTRSALGVVPLRGGDGAKGRLRNASWSGPPRAKPRSRWAPAPARTNTPDAAMRGPRVRGGALYAGAAPAATTRALTLSGYKIKHVMSSDELDYTGLIIAYRKFTGLIIAYRKFDY